VLVLGIETATTHASVALGDERGLVATARVGRAGTHGRFVAPALRFCCQHAGVRTADLTGVAVSLGPGRYTGMRVGIATVQALAHSAQLPAVGLSSLDLVAFAARYASQPVCAVIDARRGELAWAFYRASAGGIQRRSDFRLGPPERLAGEIEAGVEPVLAVGDGAVAHRALLAAAGASVGDDIAAEPSAEAVVALARPRFEREETQEPADLAPIYLRRPDARIAWSGRGALFGGTGGGDAPGIRAGVGGGGSAS
jgi:tRNA threonylcarbamoyladenosine biosynthesis protein TsaB